MTGSYIMTLNLIHRPEHNEQREAGKDPKENKNGKSQGNKALALGQKPR